MLILNLLKKIYLKNLFTKKSISSTYWVKLINNNKFIKIQLDKNI